MLDRPPRAVPTLVLAAVLLAACGPADDAGDAAADEIVAWMDWMDLEGFRAPAPGASLGGMEHLAAGRTGFVTVELIPGRYAWVSEMYGGRGMAREFTVE